MNLAPNAEIGPKDFFEMASTIDDTGPSALSAAPGFTLIELVVVLALISLMLFVTLPRLPDNPFVDEKRKTSAWLMGRIQSLKDEAVLQARDYFLHIDMESGRLWSTHDSMNADELTSARQGGFVLPEGARVQSVAFPESEPQTTGQVDIRFSRKGYAQMALIHTAFSDDTQRWFLVEPFLPGVKLYEEPISFEQ